MKKSRFSKCVCAVSYTHLDVYKRQGIYNAGGFLCSKEKKITNWFMGAGLPTAALGSSLVFLIHLPQENVQNMFYIILR